jgi:CDP-paratose 2-epimerase
LVQCNLEGRTYRIFGYKGKQVRDNIHSFDVTRFIERFVAAPRSAEVYNIGGGRQNSISILEAFQAVSEISGKPMKYEYVGTPRNGDHICYISDLTKMRSHYPQWSISKDLVTTLTEIHDAWVRRSARHHEISRA